MKKLNLIVLLIFSLSLVTVSCSSDDDNNDAGTSGGGDGTMTIDGSAFNIASGFLEDYGANGDGSYDWDVTLVSDGFNIDTANETITGTGGFLYLDLNTNSASGLVPGTYEFADNRAEFTWVYAFGSPNLNPETESGDISVAVSGTVTITGTGSSQVIDVDLVDTSGNTITASYTGDLQTLEFD